MNWLLNTQTQVIWLTFICFTIHTLFACTPELNKVKQLVAQNTKNTDFYLLTTNLSKLKDSIDYQLWLADPLHQKLELLVDGLESSLPRKTNITGMAWDAAHERLIISDAATATLFSIDPVTASISILSGPTRGEGPLFGKIGGLVFNTLHQTMVVIDIVTDKLGNYQRILTSVDLRSGDRTILASADVGQGPLLNVHAFTYDFTKNQFYAVYDTGVVVIDGYSGNRRIFSDVRTGIGFGTGWIKADTINFNYFGNRLLLTDAIMKQTIAIDLATGDRSIITNCGTSDGENKRWGRSAIFRNDRLYLTTQAGRDLFTINVENRNCNAESRQRDLAEDYSQPPIESNHDDSCTTLVLDSARTAIMNRYGSNKLLPILYPIVFPVFLWLSVWNIMASNAVIAGVCSMGPKDSSFFGIVFLLGLIPLVIFAFIDMALNPQPVN